LRIWGKFNGGAGSRGGNVKEKGIEAGGYLMVSVDEDSPSSRCPDRIQIY